MAGLCRKEKVMASKEAVKERYVDKLRAQIEHAPVAPSNSGTLRQQGGSSRDDTVEPELILAVTNFGKHDKIHSTKTSPGETFPAGFSGNNSGFLLSTKEVEVKVNQKLVHNASNQLREFSLVAYCVGGWKTSIAIRYKAIGEKTRILVDYYQLPIRCHCCLSTNHLVKDCPTLGGRQKEVKTCTWTNNPLSTRASLALIGNHSIIGSNKEGERSQRTTLPPLPPLLPGQHPTTISTRSETCTTSKEGAYSYDQ